MSESENIVKAEYTSEWTSGESITTDCLVDLNTMEVFDIEMSGIAPDGACIRETVTFNSETHEVEVDPDEDYCGYWRY